MFFDYKMNSFIRITLNKKVEDLLLEVENSNVIYDMITQLMLCLNSHIGFRTNIEYRINPVYDHTIMYEVKNYTNKQTEMKANDLVMDKFNTIVNFCQNVESSEFNMFTLWWLRGLKQMLVLHKETQGVDIRKMFTIEALMENDVLKSSTLFVNYPEPEQAHYETVKFKGGVIRYYIDPYMIDNMLCID